MWTGLGSVIIVSGTQGYFNFITIPRWQNDSIVTLWINFTGSMVYMRIAYSEYSAEMRVRVYVEEVIYSPAKRQA